MQAHFEFESQYTSAGGLGGYIQTRCGRNERTSEERRYADVNAVRHLSARRKSQLLFYQHGLGRYRCYLRYL